MYTLTNRFRLWVGKQVFRRTQAFSYISSHFRTFADTPDATPKQIMVQAQGTEIEERLRVRRARPADVPRILRFVKEHARAAWPGLAAPPAAPQLMLCDYVARALAQGHSMLAEQQEGRRGWTQIRGLALGVAVCPWDASMLEKWARCVRCASSRRLMAFTAHCLRAPALHEKYHVHTILQVVLIIPKANPKSAEIVDMLTKNAIKRSHEVGFPLIRFDVTSDKTAQILENLQLKKEWQLSYDILPEVPNASDMKETASKSPISDKEKVKSDEKIKSTYKHRVSVYTILTKTDNNIISDNKDNKNKVNS